MVAQEAFDVLTAPIMMVSPPHTPVPFADSLEDLYVPNAAKVEAAVRSVIHQRVTPMTAVSR
jgi:pyruvate dehydrogenase E1 component beta subunit